MLTFSLNAFIKICLMDTGGRISELQKRLSGPGGYDFYKPLTKAVRAYADNKLDHAEEYLNSPANAVERKHNRDAFEAFRAKFGGNKSLAPIAEAKVVKFTGAGIAVSVDPLFEVTKSGVRQVYAIWPTQKPELTQRYGAVACHLMRQAYASHSLANASFFYTDIVTSKTYSEKAISNNTNLILIADVTSIGALVKQL